MSSYTMQLRYICETEAEQTESKGWNNVPAIIDAAAPSIFGSYPIFDEEYRATLNHKILAHYYMWEIGAETVGLFKFWLNTRMNEIMPKYNVLYEALNAALAQDNIFDDTNLTTTRDTSGDTVGTSSGITQRSGSGSTETENAGTNATSGNTSSSANHINKYSDTPQGAITNLENGTYLTNASQDVDTGSTQNASSATSSQIGEEHTTSSDTEQKADTNTVNRTEQYIEKVVGKHGGKNFMLELKDAYDAFINIDMCIIRDLQDLFMGVW